VLPVNPDLVIVIEGRNEVFPQLFNGYRDDYSHYRIPQFDFRWSNYWPKRLFRISHAYMLASTKRGGRFGYDGFADNPVYAAVVYDNRPTDQEMARNAEDPRRWEGYRNHLARDVALARQAGAEILLATMPFNEIRFGSSVFMRPSPEARAVLKGVVARNNDVVREVARDSGVVVVESEALAGTAGLLHDDCHFSPAGERAFAQLAATAMEPWLQAWLKRAKASAHSRHQRPSRPRVPSPCPRSQAITPPAPHPAAPLEPQARQRLGRLEILG